MGISRRISALLTVAAIATGAMATTTAAEASTAKSSPCTKAAGKYHGRLILTAKLTGHDSEGHPKATGGTLRVYHSATCKTLWVRVDESAEYAHRGTYIFTSIQYYNTKTHKNDYAWETRKTARSLVSKAVPAGHGKADVNGGFVADYQFVSPHHVRF
ncbi:hypothetical protein [Actinoallomurus soli]|uniref:hypothetical protein n=1 Tax=Actinoallomurus soli TaxID=2952535 RepID=UPI002093D107|nr:hypothetical protein [Actinoallomurus soli]MCO5967981.1 hypothetical protein [Actinoallomurus soli]